jgi:N-acyl-D-aspartate/D-glutamate deacylase
VTTCCFGQDGESPEEHDYGAWMDRITARRPGVNIAPFIGHGTARNLAGIGMKVNPTAAELDRMAGVVADAMDDGCFGLTTGLEYDPGRFADEAELIAVARPVAARGGLVMSHMRTEDDPTIAGALAELLAQGVGAGCAVQVSHMKVTFGRDPARVDQLLAQMEAARQKGIRVTADVYPYNASHTTIDIVYPDWARPPHDFEKVVAERREELRDYLRKRIALRNGPEATLFTSAPWTAKSLAQVAAELGKPFEDVLIDEVHPGGASAAYFVINESLMERLLVDPHTMVSSDGSPFMRHPRGHGAFARIVRKYAVEKKLFSLETAIHKMTGFTAAATGLDRVGRGRIAPGFHGDALVFDPASVHDTATYEQPHTLAVGFETIFLNGRPARLEGTFAEQGMGRVVRRTESA